MAFEYRYVSTYGAARVIATFVSFIGWVIFISSLLAFVISFFSAVETLSKQSSNLIIGVSIFWTILPSFGGIVSALFLIITGQFTRATLDTADYNGEMLTIMKANLLAMNTANPATHHVTQASRPRGPEIQTVPEPPRTIEIPVGVEDQKLSVREAAQAINVANSTMQDYLKSGRLIANPDGTIDLYSLYRAGFIVRNFPPNRGT